MELQYEIRMEGGFSLRGRRELLPGSLRLTETLPAGLLASVRAELPVALARDGRIFMNGFQTWTYCP